MPWAFRPTWANMAPFFIPTEDPQWPPWLREAMDQPDAAVAPATAKGYFRWTSRETGLRMHGRHIWATSEDYAGSNNKRHVFFLHGLAEHSNKHYYTALCARLAARGYNCHLMDMQGHGYSAAVSPRRVKSAQSLIEEHGRWHYAAEGHGQDEITALRAETWVVRTEIKRRAGAEKVCHHGLC